MSKLRIRGISAIVLAMACALAAPADAQDFYEAAKLVPADGSAGDWFGTSVAISGSTAIVGTQDSRAGIYAFGETEAGWEQIAEFEEDGHGDFNSFVAIDEGRAIVGMPGSGAAFIYEEIGGVWGKTATLEPDAAVSGFGFSVSISGNTALVGNEGSAGPAYLFQDQGAGWSQVAKLLPDDGLAGRNFGWAVATDGNTAVVTADYDDNHGNASGAAYVFEDTGSGWVQVDKLIADDAAQGTVFGNSVAIGDGQIIVGSPFNGMGVAYIFTDDGTGWSQIAKLIPGGMGEQAWAAAFGMSVSISGNAAIVGANGADLAGWTYLFRDDGAGWSAVAKLRYHDAEMNDSYGVSVAIDGDTVLIGAPGDDDMGDGSGSACIFVANRSVEMESGNLVSGTTGGGTHAIGGTEVALDEVVQSGTYTADFYHLDDPDALADHVGSQPAAAVRDVLTDDNPQLWDVGFDGGFAGEATLTVTYDDTNLQIPEELVGVRHFTDGQWVIPEQVLDMDANTITVSVEGFSPFVLAEVPEPSTFVLMAIAGLGLLLWRRLGK